MARGIFDLIIGVGFMAGGFSLDIWYVALIGAGFIVWAIIDIRSSLKEKKSEPEYHQMEADMEALKSKHVLDQNAKEVKKD